MAKKVNPIDPAEIEEKALSLMKLIRRNEERKPADRVDHTVTVITKDEIGVMVCGSAHQLEDLFVDLLAKRPEMRQGSIMQYVAMGKVITGNYHEEKRKRS